MRETLRCALDNVTAEGEASGSAVVLPCKAAELELLGLSESADAMVAGVPGVRGINGCHPRQISLGEVLITQPRVLLMDAVINGWTFRRPSASASS